MLGLVLTLALTVGGWSNPQPQLTVKETTVAHVLTICDTERLTKSCSLYLMGFLDSMYAQTAVMKRVYVSGGDADIVLPAFAGCLPEMTDLNDVRRAVVTALKKSDRRIRANETVLLSIVDAYPCNK